MSNGRLFYAVRPVTGNVCLPSCHKSCMLKDHCGLQSIEQQVTAMYLCEWQNCHL